jgi:beta-N-acetylhexosaminidase
MKRRTGRHGGWSLGLISALFSFGLAANASLLLTPPIEASAASCTNVSAWSLARRLNQLLMVSGDFSNLGASAPVAGAGVGAFVLFGQPPAGSAPAISAGISALDNDARAAGQVVPWMSTDEEGGNVARLSNVIGSLPTPRWMAQNWTAGTVQSALTTHAAAMSNLGVTVDLAPVLDTALSTNTIADENDRSFSFDATVASSYGVAYMNGLRAGHVLPVGKHFPGLGQASANTDLGPAADPPLSELQTRDLIPFQRAMANGLSVVMVSHASVPDLTGTVPASLSAATYQYLRNTLGFTGVALTDSLSAGAITFFGYSQAGAAVRAVQAGADMVMIQSSAWQPTLTALQNAVNAGSIPVSRLNASVTRILQAKGISVCSSLPYLSITPAAGFNRTVVQRSGTAMAFIRGGDGFIYDQTCCWSGFSAVDRSSGITFTGTPIAAINSDGRVEVFALASQGGVVYHIWQSVPGGPWSPAGWQAFPMGDGIAVGQPEVARDSGGALHLIVMDSSGTIYNTNQTCAGCGWRPWPWDNLGAAWGTPPSVRQDAVTQALQVFAGGQDGKVYDRSWAGGIWSGWDLVGQGIPGTGNSAAVGATRNANGGLVVFSIDHNGQVWRSEEETATWSGWTPSSGGGWPTANPPEAGQNQDGRPEVFELGGDRLVYHNYLQSSGAWSGMYALTPQTPVPLTGDPALLKNSDGRLEVFLVSSADGSLWHDWQVSPNSGWSGWFQMAGGGWPVQ